MADESSYRTLRKTADRILRKSATALSGEVADDILRLAYEIETVHTELETQSRQLKQLSEALKAADRRFDDLYESAPVAFVMLTKSGFIERVNLMARQILVGDAESDSGAVQTEGDPPLVGRRFSSFVDPADRETYFRGLKRMAESGELVFFEVRLAQRKREPVNMHIQASPVFDAEQRFKHWHLALSDVSVLRRKENQLQTLHEQLEMATRAAKIGLWSYDLKNRTSQWNDELYRLLGLEPAPGPEDGERFFEFIHPEDRSGTIANLDSVMNLQEDYLSADFRVVRTDGAIRWLTARGRIYRDESGEPLHVAGVNWDITEQKEAESALHLAHLQLTEQLKRTELVNEELSQYAYAVSHDLKGPLRAIRNYADFLNEDLAGTLEGEPLKYLEGLKTAVEQGDALINDLLIFSRIGRAPLAAEAIDIPGLVDEIRSGLGLTPGVEIEVQRQWPRICADRSLMRQILQNLISNAAKFNQRKNKRIEIGCRPVPEECVELFVRDNGIGIAPEYHDQIFRIFQRLHSSSNYEGTGIGLAIVQKAAARLRGSVRLASEPGQGSTFSVRLPREPEDNEGNGDKGYEI